MPKKEEGEEKERKSLYIFKEENPTYTHLVY